MTASPFTRRARNVVRRGRRVALLAVGIAGALGATLMVASLRGIVEVPTVPAAVAVLLLALVSSAALGLAAEFQRPRIADLDEAARAAKCNGLGVVRRHGVPAPQWPGRRATWEVADDPWQLALATITPIASVGTWVLVSGDEPLEAGASAALVARAAAEEPRSTLLVDTDPVARAASTTFRSTPRAGVAEVVADGRPWDDVMQAAFTGEFRALDVVAPGAPGRARAPRLSVSDQSALRAASTRYGLTVLTLPDVAALTAADTRALAGTVALLVAVRGVTSVAGLRRRATQLADGGAHVAGVLLWDERAR